MPSQVWLFRNLVTGCSLVIVPLPAHRGIPHEWSESGYLVFLITTAYFVASRFEFVSSFGFGVSPRLLDSCGASRIQIGTNFQLVWLGHFMRLVLLVPQSREDSLWLKHRDVKKSSVNHM